MPKEMPGVLKTFLVFLKLTPFNSVAEKIEAAFSDGELSWDEGADVAGEIAKAAQGYWPKGKHHLVFFEKLTDGFVEWWQAEQAARAAGEPTTITA